MGTGNARRGRDPRSVTPASPVSRAEPPDREPSLSPEQASAKPASLLTNLLDSLYDSYVDPKEEDDGSEDFQQYGQGSVSRLDMSLSSLF